MEIRFMSSLTHEDENRVASALVRAVAELLDILPIAYSIRIETVGAKIFEHSHAPNEPQPLSDEVRVDERVLQGPGTWRWNR